MFQNDKLLTGIKSILMMLSALGVGVESIDAEGLDSLALTLTAGCMGGYGIVNAIRAFFVKEPKPEISDG